MRFKCENAACKKQIEVDEKIICIHCNTIQKKTITLKPVLAGAILASVTAIGGYKTGKMISYDNHWRYPVNVEFSIINYCINGDPTLQSYSDLNKKKNICIQAATETMKEINFADYKQNRKAFTHAFKNNLKNQY